MDCMPVCNAYGEYWHTLDNPKADCPLHRDEGATCDVEADPPDAQDHADWKADDKIRDLKEDGPRRALDKYDEGGES